MRKSDTPAPACIDALTDIENTVKTAGAQLLLPAHEGSASITHNSHKNNYLTVAQYEEYHPEWFKGAWVSDESREYAIANNELWELQWYPVTPVGFNNLCAGRWEDIVAYLKEKGLA